MRWTARMSAAMAMTIAAAAYAQPSDNCADAPTLGPGAHAFDTTAATNDGTGTCGGSATSPDMWFKVMPARSGTYYINMCAGATYDTVLGAFDGCGGTELACNDDSCGLMSQITVSATAGTPFWVRIAGFVGRTGSGTVTIEEPGPPPANDACASATMVGEGTFEFNTRSATNDGSSSCDNGDVPNDVWFNYLPSGSGIALIGTCGSATFHSVTAYSACGGSEIACNVGACGGGSRVAVSVTVGVRVRIRVAGAFRAAGSGTLTIEPPVPPAMNDNCSSATMVGEGSFDFNTLTASNDGSSTCDGGATPADVWFNYLPSATGVTFIQTCGSATDSDVSIFGACGGAEIACSAGNCAGGGRIVTSVTMGQRIWIRAAAGFDGGGAGTLSISTPIPGPANDNCANATAVGEGSFDFDTTTASGDGQGTCGASAGSPDVWFRYTPTATGVVFAETCGAASFDTVLSAFDACGGTEIICVDDSCGLQTRIRLDATLGTPIWIRVAGFGSATGTGTLTITTPAPPPANDNCAMAQNVGEGMFSFNTAAASNDGNDGCSGGGPDVWFRYTPTATGFTTISTCDSASFNGVAVFDACAGTEIACDFGGCNNGSSIEIQVTSGTAVWIRVTGDGDGGEGSLSITVPMPPPAGSWIEVGDAGELPADAQVPEGSGDLTQIRGTIEAGNADMYRIRICNYTSFDASLQGGAAFDTQLFLFNTDGIGITSNDDAFGLLSHLTSQFITADGEYYLAMSGYNYDPTGANGFIWNNTPFNVERQPDGPGAGDTISGWSGGSGFGPYTITLMGTCFAGAGRCVADFDDGSGTGTPDGGVTIDDLLYYLSLYTAGNIAADIDNGTFTGTTDGGVTIDDLLYFLFHYSEGC